MDMDVDGARFSRQTRARGDHAELARLRAMRMALVPRGLPDRPQLEMASCFLPADNDVGGDFFLVGAGSDGATVVVVGDVVGRGLEAAVRAAYVRTVLTSIVRFNDDAAEVLALANDALIDDSGTTRFATAACVTFRPADGTLAWALAGHPTPVRLSDGRPLVGGSLGPPLGVTRDFHAQSASTRLAPGCGVLVYTDGVTEARRGSMLFGERRLAGVLAAVDGNEPTEVVNAIRDAVRTFAGGSPDDDICMLALRAAAALEPGVSEEVCSPELVAPLASADG